MSDNILLFYEDGPRPLLMRYDATTQLSQATSDGVNWWPSDAARQQATRPTDWDAVEATEERARELFPEFTYPGTEVARPLR